MHAETNRLRPFRHTGDSANIAHYREDGASLRGARREYIWCEVLCSALDFRKAGPTQAKPHASYHGTVYRSGEGEIARFAYTPKRRTDGPGGAGPLPARTVARLVREALDL